MDNEETLRLLRSIDRRLALLTLPMQKEIRERLVKDVLRTDARIAIYDALDGSRTSPEIARVTGASERAVQVFVKELLDAGLVRATGKAGRGLLLERDDDGLTAWYVERAGALTSVVT